MFNLVVLGDFLYVGTWSADSGAEIWRTGDGREWSKVFKVVGEHQDYIRAFARMGDKLYASTGKLRDWSVLQTQDGLFWTNIVKSPVPPYLTDGFRVCGVGKALVAGVSAWKQKPAELWRYYQEQWAPISEPGLGSPDNDTIGAMTVFKGTLALATWNETRGCQVWLCDDVMNPHWEQVNKSGFGNRRNAGCAFGMAAFNGKLYVGTAPASSDTTSWSSQLWVGFEDGQPGTRPRTVTDHKRTGKCLLKVRKRTTG